MRPPPSELRMPLSSFIAWLVGVSRLGVDLRPQHSADRVAEAPRALTAAAIVLPGLVRVIRTHPARLLGIATQRAVGR